VGGIAVARILVIEDNPTNLELMTYLLKAFGHEVSTACDGEEGLNAARRANIDLIVCDVQLPKIDGFGVAARLKGHPTFRSIPLIAVTALAMVGDRDKLLSAGFNGYISKPIDPEKFVGQVEAFIPAHTPGVATQAVSQEPATEPHVSAASPVEARATILAVDDSPANLQLICSTLEPFGYKVIAVSTIASAMAMAQQFSPDLIISDLHMRGETGFDFIKKIKRDLRLKNIPFVFLSATVWKRQDQVDGLALGAVKFILRPIDPEMLIREVEECLGKN